MAQIFVPTEFQVPPGITRGDLRLTPLDVEHNERDYRAWMSSIEHIHATPGFPHDGWPYEMSLEDNRIDLARHADDFRRRTGFTYSALIGDEVIGCVYIYPTGRPGEATVRSWVSRAHADRDRELFDLVTDWLRETWPFQSVLYASRGPARVPR